MPYPWILAAMLAVALSAGLKLQNRRHGVLFFLTPDTEHVMQAATWHGILSQVAAPHRDVENDRFRYPALPSKYPMFSTVVYRQLLGFMDYKFPGDFHRFLPLVRTLHIAFFACSCLVILTFPFSWPIRIGGMGLASASMILHQYGGDVRLHALSGALYVMAIAAIIRIPSTRRPWAMSLGSGALVGLVAGSLFTGALGILPLLSALVMRAKSGTSAWTTSLGMGVGALMASALTFSAFFPSIWLFLQGEAPLFYMGHFRDQSMLGLFGWGGMQGYLNDLFGVDPLCGVGYILGLYFMLKSRSWRKPEWMLVAMAVIPYQLAMAAFYDYTVRRASFVIPVVVLVAAYGYLELWARRRRVAMTVIGVLGLFAVSCMVKYNMLTAADTRMQYHAYAVKELRGSLVLQDQLMPQLDSNVDGTRGSGVEGRNLEDLLDAFGRDSKAHHAIMKRFPEGREAAKNPEAFPWIMRLFGLKHFATNNHWRRYKAAKDVSHIIKESDLLVSFEQCHQRSDYEDMAWPPDGNSYYIWKMWGMARGGPTIRVYRLRD